MSRAPGDFGSGPGVGHRPVLLEEVLSSLRVRAGGRYIDCTLGGGGHAAAVLELLGPEGRLLALDRDPTALHAWRRHDADQRCLSAHACFSQVAELAAAHGMESGVDGILADLGISSLQLDDPRRGFGFLREGPLDMRMDQEQGESVTDWMRDVPAREIEEVLVSQGGERHARRIAQAIVRVRCSAPIVRGDDLGRIIEGAVPCRENRRHPATRAFLALRRHINDEAGQLQCLLRAAPGLLAVGGRLLIISFHSLEDRLVKTWLRSLARAALPHGSLEPPPPPAARFRVVGRPVRSGLAERTANRRSRSALLRVLERTA